MEEDEISSNTVEGSEFIFTRFIFSPRVDELRLSRREKRIARHEHGLVRAQTPPQRGSVAIDENTYLQVCSSLLQWLSPLSRQHSTQRNISFLELLQTAPVQV